MQLTCVTVSKLKKEKRKQCKCTDVSLHVVHILSIVETENTYTPARLEALFTSSHSSVPPIACSPSFRKSDFVRGPFRNFVKRSAVLSFVSALPTDRLFSDLLLYSQASTFNVLESSLSSSVENGTG